MLALCAAFIGSLCVPLQFVAVSQHSSMFVRVDSFGQPLKDKFDAAQSRRQGIKIITWDSDNIEDVSPIGLDRVCAQNWCVYYRKHCTADGSSCTYVTSNDVLIGQNKIADDGLVIASGIQIQARTKALLLKVENRLKFIVHFENADSFVSVPLTQLNRTSPDLGHLRNCMRSIWVQGCGRPTAPERRRFEHP